MMGGFSLSLRMKRTGAGAYRILLAVAASLAPRLSAQTVQLRTNQAAPVANLLACPYHPRIAPGLTLTGPGVLAEVTVVVSGGDGMDAVSVDPDPTVPCSYGAPRVDGFGGPSYLRGADAATCSRCYPLVLQLSQWNGTKLKITVEPIFGIPTTSVWESCLRRVYLGPAQLWNRDLGSGLRTVTFEATTAVSGATSSGTADVMLVAEGEPGAACSAALPAALTVRIDTENKPASVYETSCAQRCGATGSYRTYLQPSISVTYPPSGSTRPALVQSATITTRVTSEEAVQAHSQDRFWVAPVDAGGTLDSPCGPNITVIGQFTEVYTSYAYLGPTLYGLATADEYTACLRNVYYWNTAADPTAVVTGTRSFETTVQAPATSGLEPLTTRGGSISVAVSDACDQQCPSTLRLGFASLSRTPKPTDIQGPSLPESVLPSLSQYLSQSVKPTPTRTKSVAYTVGAAADPAIALTRTSTVATAVTRTRGARLDSHSLITHNSLVVLASVVVMWLALPVPVKTKPHDA